MGLGPGDPSLRTVAGQRALESASRILLRTRIHPGLEEFVTDLRVSDCDDLYERGKTFDEVYVAIVERTLALAEDGHLVYAVPGHPLFGERTVDILRHRAQQENISVEVVSAVSAVDAVAEAVEVDPFASQLQLLDALHLRTVLENDPFSGGDLGINPYRPCLVTQVYAHDVASAVKLALGRLYPDDHPVQVIRSAGVPSQETRTCIPLYVLDHQPVDHLTSVYVEPMAPLAGHRHPATLQQIVAQLRRPGGCPWDRVQTHSTLRAAVIEEAYEVIDAIDSEDRVNLSEELGDLLLQVMLHAQIAEEAGDFAFEDVVEQVSAKLIRRHPHVFGDVSARTPTEVVKTWNQVKAEERLARGEEAAPRSKLDRLPRSMPALTRAARLLEAADLPPMEVAPPPTRSLGDQLLDLVSRIVASGSDPEAVLDATVRRRLAAAPLQGVPAE